MFYIVTYDTICTRVYFKITNKFLHTQMTTQKAIYLVVVG